jgi:hypothetical protein
LPIDTASAATDNSAMSNQIRIIASAIALLVPLAASPAFARDALAGKWTATVTPDDATNAKEFTDTLTFKGGKLESAELTKQGYDSATVNDSPSPIGVASKFDVTLTNKAGDTAAWTGTTAANEMTGTLTITRKDGTKITYSFKASKG